MSSPDTSYKVVASGKDACDLEGQDEHEKTLMLCRRASKLHFQMNLFPGVLIQQRIMSKFHVPHMRWQQRLCVLISMIIVLALPLGYARTLMPYPCNARTVIEQHVPVNATLHQKVQAGFMKVVQWDTNCNLQDYMRDMGGGLRVGSCVVAASIALTLCMSGVTAILNKYKCHTVRMSLWRPLLFFWYMWIEPQANKLKFANEAQLFPGLYTPTSVVICFVYILIVAEVTYIGVASGDTATGVVVAYTLAQGFLKVSNYVLGGSEETMAVMDGLISHWVPGADYDRIIAKQDSKARLSALLSSGAKVRTVMDKLHKATAMRKMTCALSASDLTDLERLPLLLSNESGGHLDQRMADDDRSLSSVGIITKIYLHDTHEVVDLITGRFKLLSPSHDGWQWD